MNASRFYRVIRFLAKLLCAVIFPTKVEGRDNLPAAGPVLLCSNHVSLVDPVLLAVSLKRPVTFLAKKELFSNRFGNWFLSALGMVPVDRGASDIQAIRVCLDVLGKDGVLGIFPQGHRYRADDHRELQNGAALMALRSKAAVVAAHVSAPMRPFRRVRIRVSRPIDLSDMQKVNSGAITAATARIADNIWQEDGQHGD